VNARVLLPLLLTLAAVGISWMLLGRSGPSSQPVTEHPVAVPAATRTVTVSATMPSPSTAPHQLSAMLEEGVMPDTRTMAEVMSDTQCTPDAQMISRCRNEVRLSDGTTLVLRHPHDMRDIPCLAPGEIVTLVPASA
jgi:hypothetical protein